MNATARLFLAAAVLLSPAGSDDSWKPLGASGAGGGLSASEGDSTEASIDLDSSGRPVVVWTERDAAGLSELQVRRWSGTAWIDLTPGLTSGPDYFPSPFPRVKVAADGKIVVTWIAGSIFAADCFLKVWDGDSWEELGGSGSGYGVSQNGGLFLVAAQTPSLALDAAGHPVVAYTNSGDIRVKRWTGTEWVELPGSGGAGLTGTNQAFYPDLALDSAGKPWVAWVHGLFIFVDPVVRVLHWTGEGWSGEGGSDSEAGLASDGYPIEFSPPSIVVDATDRPAVAWIEFISGGEKPVYQPVVKRWTGSFWEKPVEGLEPVIAQSSYLLHPSLAVLQEQRLVLAWSAVPEGAEAPEVYVKTWAPEASGWSAVGESTGAGGISATGTNSGRPAVAAGPGNAVAVVWQEILATESGLLNDIYLKTTSLADTLSVEDLRQVDGGSLELVEEGGAVDPAQGLRLGGRVCAGDKAEARLEIEIKPVGIPFDGTATILAETPAVAEVVLIDPDLAAPGTYRWRARAKGQDGSLSEWTSFGEGDEAGADFFIALNSPDTSGPGGGGGSGGGCSGSPAGAAGGLLLAAGLLLRRRVSR